MERTEDEETKFQTERTEICLATVVESFLANKFTESRVLRAGVIYNIMRGLQIHNTCPLPCKSPTKSHDEDDFKGHFEPTEMHTKKLYLVDSGLTFNLPFPLLLRPQRAVDLYLCFDFSTRRADDDSPFDELVSAEKWARLSDVPFPPIEKEVEKYINEPLKECYVFEDLEKLEVPVILFFPLVNNQFRHFKAPGVKRETKEEKHFGSFDIFSDPKKPFDTFKFQYTNEDFDHLAGLVEFNTLYSEPLIRKYVKLAVERKQRFLPKPLILPIDCHYTHLKPEIEEITGNMKNYVKLSALEEKKNDQGKDECTC